MSLLAVALSGAPASASTITFTGAEGSLAASVRFETSGDDLIVTLSNVSTQDVTRPTEVLTALFFDVRSPSPLNLTRESAMLGASAIVLFDSAPGGVVGGEWAYERGIHGAPRGARYGISSTGLDIFGSSGRFPGPNLQGPLAVNGLQYGITSAGDDPTRGNSAVTGHNGLIKSEVVLTLSGLPAGFDPAMAIKNVTAQYGTDLCDPQLCLVIPEPASSALMTLGAVALMRRRRGS